MPRKYRDISERIIANSVRSTESHHNGTPWRKAA